MKCKEFKKNLYQLFSEEEVSSEMKLHLESCTSCKKAVENIKAVAVNKICVVEEEVSPFFLSKCEANLEKALEENKNLYFVNVLKPVLATLFVVLAIGSGVLFGKQYVGNNFSNEQVNEQSYTETLSLDSYENYYLSE